MNKYKKIQVLGEGGFGRTILASKRVKCVIKKILIQGISEEERHAVRSELDTLLKLKHTNIAQCYDWFYENDEILCLDEEFCGGVNLAIITPLLKSRRGASEHEVMNWFIQLSLAVEYIHDRNIVHRDIRPENIYLTKMNVIKLGGFGISKMFSHRFSFDMGFTHSVLS